MMKHLFVFLTCMVVALMGSISEAQQKPVYGGSLTIAQACGTARARSYDGNLGGYSSCGLQ